MVVVREWQWQYWQSCGGLKMGEKKKHKIDSDDDSGGCLL
jgi:hypothetical protein